MQRGKKIEYEFVCLECKRKICKECSKFHISHKLYENKHYLYNKDKLKK